MFVWNGAPRSVELEPGDTDELQEVGQLVKLIFGKCDRVFLHMFLSLRRQKIG